MSRQIFGRVRSISAAASFALLGLTAPARADYATALLNQLESLMHPPADAPYALSGTAFFISNKELLTVAHAVRGCQRVDLLSESMTVTSAVVVAADARPDLAVLKVSSAEHPKSILQLASASPSDGDRLNVLGYPIGSDIRHAQQTPARVANSANDPKLRSTPYVLMLDGRTEQGDSGAPILDHAGHVVGLVKGGFETAEAAQKVLGVASANISVGPTPNLVDVFYHQAGLKQLPRSNNVEHVADTNVDTARSAVVRVVCWQTAPTS